ncbi:Intracellular distribution of mitochondria [Ceratocystis pirilliformis]|uniref:Clustered mitochondria protein homolog n=1 Tax=Ceratocystis pirilliformis TaxID=259994 RepID=A0ABR3YIS9_9PEZI
MSPSSRILTPPKPTHSALVAREPQEQEPVEAVDDSEVAADIGADEIENDVQEQMIELLVKLPQRPFQMGVAVSTQEQIHEIRQTIIDSPDAYQYTCFHLEFNGQRITDFVPLGSIEGILEKPEVTLVEDPYTEKEARIHLVRTRELIGAATERIEATQGVTPGITLLETVDAQNSIDIQELLTETPESPAQPIPVGVYDFSSEPTPSEFVPTPVQSAPKTIKALSISPWNPPPHNLRQKGHLLYLMFTTLEGEQFQVTSHVSGFYISKTSNAKFDPFPRPPPKAASSHSLMALISMVSPGFKAAFEELQAYNNRRDALATFQCTNAIPAAPWLVPSATTVQSNHSSDMIRSQEGFIMSGVDNTDSLRDWNEEFQSAKELPRETVPDRVFRERLLSKLYADYVEASTKGAIMVARGEIAPLNPTELTDAQIFVHNNVFFSFGADGVGTFTSEGGDEAARVATGKDVAGVRLVNQLDIDGIYTAATVVVDYLGKRVVGQSIVPGIFRQRDPGENQIDYGGVEGKEVVAADQRFAEPFAKLSKALKVKAHPVWDKDGKRFDLEASVETKGLMGTDGRKYVLDLYRVTPLDLTWMEGPDYPHRMTVLRTELVDIYARQKMKEWAEAKYKEHSDAQKANADAAIKSTEEGEASKEEEAEEAEEKAEEKGGEVEKAEKKEPDLEPKEKFNLNIADFEFSLNPDVYSGQIPQTEEETEELDNDEDRVREVCDYLLEQAIPNLLKDLSESDVGFPMDSPSLSLMLHKRGINIRYLGKIIEQATDSRLEALRIVGQQDIIARAFKHVSRKYMADLPFVLATSCYAHLLNCLLGWRVTKTPEADVDESLQSLYPDANMEFVKVTTDSIKAEIAQNVTERFRFTLPEDWLENVKPVQLLREISISLGLQIEAKTYNFGLPKAQGFQSDIAITAASATPTAAAHTNGAFEGGKKKKGKKAREASPDVVTKKVLNVTFMAEDIVNIVPVIKHSTPRSALAEEAFEAGRISILQGQRKLGQELLLESLSLHEQIYGILHPEVARVYNSLSTIYYQMDEKQIAIELARKAIVVSERTLGVDSPETLLNYLNLSLFMHQIGRSDIALAYAKHALKLWKLVYGVNHPDQITAMNNAAVMLQQLKEYHESRRWFEESLRVCEEIFGEDSVNSAMLQFQLSQALALDSDAKAAVTRMRKSFNIFAAHLGKEDKNTKEAEAWLERLTQNAVTLAKQEKFLEARGIRPESLLKNRLNGGAGIAGRTLDSEASKTPNVDGRSIDDLVSYIEGPGHGPSSKKGRSRGGKQRK